MALKLYKKTSDIWITHICLYVISWELANVLGTWTSLLSLKWWNRCSQNWASEISALSVPPIGKGCMHEMATRRNDKSPSVLVWVILLSSATANQTDVMSDADCILNVQGIVISMLPSSLSVASLQKTCGLKKRRIYVDTTDKHTMKYKQFRAITWTAFESSIWLAYIYWRVV